MKWDELGKLIGAAAGVVTLLFGLFNSVLAELVPPVAAMSASAITGMASVVALVILFVLALTLQRRLQVAQRQRIALLAGVAALAGLGLFFVYYGDLDRHTFRWPETAMSDGAPPARHLRGDYTPTGLEMTRDMSLPAAIAQAGGLDTARRQQLLWDEDSRKAVEIRLVAQYILLTSLLAGALFGLALAVMFSGRGGGKT
jgi:hypothetical protein